MKIIKKVQVKQVVTEKSKAKLKETFIKRKMRLEQECQQLMFEKRKLQNKPGLSRQSIDRRFQQEIRNRKEEIQGLDFKLEQLEVLENGSELIEQEVEALVEVSEGSHWDEIIKNQSIVIQDNIVIRIDN